MDYTPLDYFRCADYWATHYRGRFDVFNHIFIGFLAQYGFTKRGVVYRYTYKGKPISKSNFYVGYMNLIYADELFGYSSIDIANMYKKHTTRSRKEDKMGHTKNKKVRLMDTHR